jgi:hypothetical protein
MMINAEIQFDTDSQGLKELVLWADVYTAWGFMPACLFLKDFR